VESNYLSGGLVLAKPYSSTEISTCIMWRGKL